MSSKTQKEYAAWKDESLKNNPEYTDEQRNRAYEEYFATSLGEKADKNRYVTGLMAVSWTKAEAEAAYERNLAGKVEERSTTTEEVQKQQVEEQKPGNQPLVTEAVGEISVAPVTDETNVLEVSVPVEVEQKPNPDVAPAVTKPTSQGLELNGLNMRRENGVIQSP